ARKREAVARIFNENRAAPAALAAALRDDKVLAMAEADDIKASLQLNDLLRADFSVVKMIRREFGVRRPEQIRQLARKSESEWGGLVTRGHAVGEIKIPIEVAAVQGRAAPAAAQAYGKMLERQFREAFPTAAFAGGLERALGNGGARGVPQAAVLK